MKKTLIIKLREACDEIALDNKACNRIAKYCSETYGVPLSRTKDLISDRIDFNGCKEVDLFYLSDGIDKEDRSTTFISFFDEKEVQQFSKEKYEAGKIVWPLRINCIEVQKNRQWIGTIDTSTLIDLYKAGKIKYNANKQRTRTKIMKGDEMLFVNTVKTSSVNQIAKLMETDEYIPDDLTLDIPTDLDSEWEFEEYEVRSVDYSDDRIGKVGQLVIKSIENFDITDGWHRFKAILQCVEKNPMFHYIMELRITRFSEQRSRQFIFQKDQKTKMSVSDSKSMNTFRPSNDIVTRLNERGSGCFFSGLISRNEGRVSFSALSDLVEYYYIKKPGRVKKKELSNREIAVITTEVKEILNTVAGQNPDYFDKKYLGYKELASLFYMVKKLGYSPDKAAKTLEKVEENGEIKKITLNSCRSEMFHQLEAVYGKGEVRG